MLLHNKRKIVHLIHGLLLGFMSVSTACFAEESTDPNIFSRTWNTVTGNIVDITQNGKWDLALPFYTWHMPYAYTAEKRRNYNNFPLGFGISRSKFLDNGNLQGIYFMTFKDSHNYFSYMVGYDYNWLWGNHAGFYGGIGLTPFIMSRQDYGHYTPFPGVLPLATLGFGHVSFQAAFVPGFSTNKSDPRGNVTIFWVKFSEKARPTS